MRLLAQLCCFARYPQCWGLASSTLATISAPICAGWELMFEQSPPIQWSSAISDTLPTATRVSDPGLRALYRQESRWQAWLDVEVALAKAQEELGIIPQGAAA